MNAGTEVTLALQHYPVLARARQISSTRDLDILEMRKYLGIPLANEVRAWLQEQPPLRPLYLDFAGVRAVSLSVAEELGPQLMQSVSQSPALEHRYPVYIIDNPEHAYTFGQAFTIASWSGLAVLPGHVESTPSIHRVAEQSQRVVVVLGQVTKQMEQILALADQRAAEGGFLTSDGLTDLDFLSSVSPGARSKRLTDLYSRRLLAFRENPRNPKERLFVPVWSLESHEQFFAA